MHRQDNYSGWRRMKGAVIVVMQKHIGIALKVKGGIFFQPEQPLKISYSISCKFVIPKQIMACM